MNCYILMRNILNSFLFEYTLTNLLTNTQNYWNLSLKVDISEQKISYILWAMLENGWKCIFNWVSYFISILLKFYVFCGAYAVQKNNPSLLKNSRIICLHFVKFLKKYFLNNLNTFLFLKVSSKIEEHLWLHFVFFLNRLSSYEAIHC